MNTQLPPNVAIVVLNWNGADDTLACLDSLAALTYPNFEVVVMDNGSTDDSASLIRMSFPKIRLIETGANLGFAEGNNVGIRAALEAGADYVLLLNNDTIVAPDLLEAFAEAAAHNPDGGMFSAKIYYHAEPTKLWYAGAKWLSSKQCFEHVGIGEIDYGKRYEAIAETDYASGCALFVSAVVIGKLGLMDPKFFLTYEETDWCYRARAAGYRVLFVPSAKVWHKVSASFGGVESPLQLYFYSRNILLWAERHIPRAAYWALFRKTFRDALRFSTGTGQDGAMFKRWIWAFTSLWQRLRRGGRDAAGRARYLGFRDYLLRRFGDCPDEVRHLRSGR